MAETIRYDTSDDPVAAKEIADKEAESLKIGEELMSKQDKMLAGKYKSAEELESAYIELQKKLGESPTPTEPESEAQPEYNMYSEDGAVNYETANELYGEQLGNLFKNNKIDPFAMNKYFAENNGTLSEDMYSELNTAGLSKEIVDSYLEGVRAKTGVQPTQAELSQSEIDEIRSIANGEEGYNSLMEWASNNLNKDDVENYDSVLATGNKTAIKFAVKALMGQYEDANGRDSNIITGKPSAPDTYRSMAEVVRDMNKPEYSQDEAFRDDVIRKLAASKLKV